MSNDKVINFPGGPEDQRKTDPDKVAKLAADIYGLVQDRDLLLAEGIMAGLLALTHLTENCGCLGCRCGEKAHERASSEIRSDIGDAAIRMFDIEIEAREPPTPPAAA